MSQEKVDRYKKEKASRASAAKKEQQAILRMKIGGILVAVVMVAWIAYSVYDLVYEEPVYTYSVKADALNDYLSDMNSQVSSAAETETDAETEAETGEETEAESAADTEAETAEETSAETESES